MDTDDEFDGTTDEFERLIEENINNEREKNEIKEDLEKAKEHIKDLELKLREYKDDKSISKMKIKYLNYIKDHPRQKSLNIQEKVYDLIEEFTTDNLTPQIDLLFRSGTIRFSLEETIDIEYALLRIPKKIGHTEMFYDKETEYPILLNEMLNRFELLKISIIYKEANEQIVDSFIEQIPKKYHAKITYYQDVLIIDIKNRYLFGG